MGLTAGPEELQPTDDAVVVPDKAAGGVPRHDNPLLVAFLFPGRRASPLVVLRTVEHEEKEKSSRLEMSPAGRPQTHQHFAQDTTRPDAPRTRSTSLDFIQQKLRRLTVKSSAKSPDFDASATRGPLGLNLLHGPSDPHIDFIFIHGLGGGSRKTWSFSPEPGMFWPKDWLPNEAGFRHVQLHSYGYNSDWTTSNGSRLSVHDFGQALLADIYNSPALRKHGDTPIVLVAHSMGGLVAKKAYLLATRDPTYQGVARRIHTMYFLATPHRGADSAQFARLVRHPAVYGSKVFVEDLLPGSGTLDQINDEFRHVCGQLNLWSFFEGAETSFGLMSSIVVNKESAVLGLPREHVQYMEADHRQICKFSSPTDPNYIIMQRCFLTTIEELETDVSVQRRDGNRAQMKIVSSFLRVDQRPDAVLLATSQKQQHGTCKWLTGDETFQKWLDDWQDVDPLTKISTDSSSRILWLNGRPGTGKSVAASHVIRYLEACNLDCSFYFFRHDDKATSIVSGLLRSLAYQMAESSFDVRRCFTTMVQDEVKINLDDHHMIWRTLFVDRILKLELTRPHFWVIDAVDECLSKDLPVLIPMLSTLSDPSSNQAIRILVTSRPGGAVERLWNLEHTPFFELNTGQEGSLKDIELFLAARCPQSTDKGPHRDLVADVLSRSNGIFLWASLTMVRLEDTYSVEDMQDILREMPSEMDEFYSRIIASIAATPSSELAKCILKWTICAPKPLSTHELLDAVKLDIGRTLTASPSQLETITGHLTFVDENSRIHVTHQTTAAFLTQQREGFWIDRTAAHTRIAEICLETLCGPEFTPPRTRRGTSVPKSTTISAFADYANNNFAYHLLNSSSAADNPLILLNRFLRSNVLTWIERTITAHGLAPLQHTAQRLKAYMRRRAKYQPPVSVEIQTVARWVTDISHIVAVFHTCLLASPLSIHFLVPHFCPQNSIIRELFGKPTKRLRITSALEEDWSDRLTSYLFPVDATSIAQCYGLLAVGLHNGEIRLFDSAASGTFNPAWPGMIPHFGGRRIRQLGFSSNTSLFSCSARKLQVWSIMHKKQTGLSCDWDLDLDFTPSDVWFSPSGEKITIANPQQSALVIVGARDGKKDETVLLHGSADSDSSDGSDEQLASWTPAARIRLDPCHRFAAVSYRNASVAVWDLEDVGKIGDFSPEGFESAYSSPEALDMIFNPVPEIGLLAISYKNGDVVTVSPDTLEQQEVYHLSTSLTVLAASSNGRVLAGGAEDGSIHLFHFETLAPFYRISPPDEQTLITNIIFSEDNLRLFDIRGQCCNVWEPFALVQKDRLDDSSSESHSDEISLAEPATSQAHVFHWGDAITVLEHTSDGKYAFTGHQDGTVHVHEISSGDVICKLPLHGSFAEIQHMGWNGDTKYLLSVDTTGRCLVTHIALGTRDKKAQTRNILDHRESTSIHQALLSPGATSLLIRTDSTVKLISMQGNTISEDRPPSEVSYIHHPSNTKLLIAIQPGHIHLLEWASLKKLSPTEGIPITGIAYPTTTTDLFASTGRLNSSYLASANTSYGENQPTGYISALRGDDLTHETREVAVQSQQIPSLSIKTTLGILRSSLYFLDTTGWVCSISLKNLAEAKQYTRHFFIPPTWYAGGDLVARIISKTAVAFARVEQLVVFHGFLEVEETVTIGDDRIRGDGHGLSIMYDGR